ncbi:MAG: hypothetical protein HYY23_20075 [Verrucomicrobia bacterium]|nr:hypothetical protein [Verrucomicrobiota bacterium]
MKQNIRLRLMLLACSLAGASAAVTLQAADTLIDFNADPQAAGTYKELGNGAAEWRKDGGAGGKPGDGYLAITDARGGQQSTLVFKDLDPGKVIKAFTFEADLRIGGGTARPADGFSLNFVRIGDPLLTHADEGTDPAYQDFAGTDNEAHLPEEGSATGLGIGFDTWQSAAIKGVPDVVGISVRVDGDLITQFPVPLKPGNLYPGGTYDEVPYRNLDINDPNYKFSMQTGKRNEDPGFDPGPAQTPFSEDPVAWALNIKYLKWEKFKAEMTEDAKLKIFWKGVELTPAGGLQTKFFPSGGRIVLAGRTGGAWEVHHIDNIKLTTVSVTDSSPPTAPANLASASVGSRRVSIKWDAATDDSGKVAYNVQRDGKEIVQFKVDPTFTDTAVLPGKSYSYKVQTVDPAGNKSAFTTELKVTTPAEVPSTGYMLVEYFTGITGTALDGLRTDAKFPGSPDLSEYVERFESKTGFGDNYGGRLSGFITPSETASYIFFLAADDNAELWLSSDDKVANLQLIAAEPEWNGERQWVVNDRRPGCPTACENRSKGIRLEAGKRYYVEAVWKEGGGGDNCAVTMIKEGETLPANGSPALSGGLISGQADAVGSSVSITQQPQNATTSENTTATFTVAATSASPYFTTPVYQWYKSGIAIRGANSASYTTALLKKADSGAKYKCLVAMPGVSATSSEVTLTVNDDTTPPAIVKVTGSDSFNRVTVEFSEPVTAATAGTAGNYTIAGLTVSSVSVLSDTKVRLTTGKQAENTDYTLTVANIQDTATGKANVIAAPANARKFKSFVLTPGVMKWESYRGIPGNAVSDLTGAPKFANGQPDEVRTVNLFEGPTNYDDAYGARIFGFITPEKAGKYQFLMSTDDNGELWLSTDDTAANKALITSEPQWGAVRSWTSADRRPGCPDACENRSAFISLQAGKRYYAELLYKEGGGGDNGAVTWRLEGDPLPREGSDPLKGNLIAWYAEPAEPVGAKLAASRDGANIKIEWAGAGALESADDVTGAWSAVANAKSPFTAPTTGNRKFYRLRQ